MTRADVATIVYAVVASRPAQVAVAAAETAIAVGFLALMAAAIAVDVAFGRGSEWPS